MSEVRTKATSLRKRNILQDKGSFFFPKLRTNFLGIICSCMINLENRINLTKKYLELLP